jgi:DNA-binding transcriptional LysR family regulator
MWFRSHLVEKILSRNDHVNFILLVRRLRIGQLHPNLQFAAIRMEELIHHAAGIAGLGNDQGLSDDIVNAHSSGGMIKSFVASGLGVSLISASFARDDVAAHRVKLVPLRDVELWRELGLAYRRDRTHTRPAAAFIATIKDLSFQELAVR